MDLARDLVLPTLMFMAVGGMSWAVRGSSGFGAVAGCLFAGVLWGTTWWCLSYDPSPEQSRRYSSSWIVLAVTIGVGLSGARGWMQWPSFFEGKLLTDYARNQFIPISRGYGFLWLFIAGVPWAGIGACLLAWCGSKRETRAAGWLLRIALGLSAAALARWVYDAYPALFLPLYRQHEAEYHDLAANPNLRRLINDCGSAITHLGYYLGFLLFELIRRDWKNVVLISTVGLINGAGWAACQNWKWAADVFSGSTFNFWRCWESSGGLSIGLAYGIAYFLVNRPMSADERAAIASRRSLLGPSYEWLLVYAGLASLAALYLTGQLAAWRNAYAVAVLAIGAAYYVVQSRKTLDGAPRQASAIELSVNAIGGLAVTGAFAAYFLWSEPIRLWARRSLGELLGGRTMRMLLGDIEGSPLRFALTYFTAVAVLGLAWWWIRRRAFDRERAETTPADGDANLDRLGLYLGVLVGLGLSIRNGAKGWFNIYRPDRPENEWSREIWRYLGPAFLVCLIAIGICVVFFARPRGARPVRFPHAYGVLWLVLIVQNAIAQAVTGAGPRAGGVAVWNEAAFAIYYVLLFVISTVIAIHDQSTKRRLFAWERVSGRD
jgi:hypothetical protein